MAAEIDFSVAPWIRSSGLPDPNGPNEVPYTPYNRDWLDWPLVDVIGEISRRMPARIAIDDGVIRLTYSQLWGMACRLGRAIAQADLHPGPIGIRLPYDAMHTVAILGCLAAGRPSLLLNPDSPPDYNRRLAEAAGLQAILVNAASLRNTARTDGPSLIPIEQALMTGGESVHEPAVRLGSDEPAFIVSTSGSTGAPKLLARSTRRVQLSAYPNIDLGHFNETDRFLNLGAAANGAVISRMFVPFLIGGSLHIVDIPRAGMGGILRALRDRQITVVRTTVSLMKSLSQLDGASAHFASLRIVWVGGETLLQKDLAQIRAVLPSTCRFGYSLSMTETPVARWFVPQRDDHDSVRVAAGYLVPDTDVLVLGDDGRPCRVGELGELIVRSHVAIGEWVDGHVIPGRFEHDPIDPTKRIYRTGDLVRICPDGVIVVHGRKDRMIKVRGQRVEPAVIETAIRNVPGVADAAVAAKQIDGDFHIYGFVVPRAGIGDDLLPMVEHALVAALPAYMRPSEIHLVQSLPVSASGKVDLSLLLRSIPVEERGAVSDDVSATPLRRTHTASDRARSMVADAWRVAFGTRAIPPTLSFDAAGGDSLKFMQIVFRLEQLGKKTLPLSAFGISMTREDMAGVVDILLDGGAEPQRGGQRIFMLPGVGGDEPRLLQFRAGCAPDLSIVSLDYGDWPQWVGPGVDFDAVLDRLVAQIQTLAPSGPISLAGYSLGGQAALAIAAKLQAAGRQVDRLLVLDSESLIDSRANNVEPGQRAPLTRREEYLEWRVARRRDQGAFVIARIVTRRLLSPRWAPLLRWLARHRRSVLRGKLDFYLTFHLQRSLLAELAGAWRRRLSPPSPLPIPITLFLADRQARNDFREAGWKQHSPAVTVVRVGGDHFTMLDSPHLADLCARFRAACGLSDAERRVAS